MKTLYVFGNEYLPNDAFAHEVARHLSQSVHIVKCKSPEELFESPESDILILDVIKGISAPMLLTDMERIKTRPLVSMHDFDVGFFLALMRELGVEKHIRVIGVPEQGDSARVAQEVSQWL